MDAIIAQLIEKWPFLAFPVLGIAVGVGSFYGLRQAYKTGREERKEDRKDYIDELCSHNSFLQEATKESKTRISEIESQLKDKEALVLQKDSILTNTQNLTRLLLDDNVQMKEKIDQLSGRLRATEFALLALNWINRRETFSRMWLIQILIRSKPKDNENLVMEYFSQNVEEINQFLNANDVVLNSITYDASTLTDNLVDGLAKHYLSLPIKEESEKIRLIDDRHLAFVEKEKKIGDQEKVT